MVPEQAELTNQQRRVSLLVGGKMNTIALIGVNGKAGRFLVKEALIKKYKVKVLVRDSRNLKYFMHYLHENVEIKSKKDIEILLKGCNAVINTVGHLKNCDGFYGNITKNIIDVMKELDIKRYISVTSGALKKDTDNRGFFHSLASTFMYKKYALMMSDKEEAASILEKSEINWSLYRLPKIVEETKAKEIKLNYFTMEGLKINNRNLAKFLINQIESNEHFQKMPFIWE
jgi:putative NADH-flavin reductase